MSALTMPVLVLNKNWTPIRITTARKALSKLLKGSARAVTSDFSVYDFASWMELAKQKDSAYVVTAMTYVNVPDIILLAKYGEIPKRVLTFSRANIFRRDKNTCQFCGVTPGTSELTIDHVIPRSRGGKSTWLNCVVACIKCNRKKADHLLEEVGMKLARKPIRPEWTPRIVLQRVKNTPDNWSKFVSDAYWNTQLQED